VSFKIRTRNSYYAPLLCRIGKNTSNIHRTEPSGHFLQILANYKSVQNTQGKPYNSSPHCRQQKHSFCGFILLLFFNGWKMASIGFIIQYGIFLFFFYYCSLRDENSYVFCLFYEFYLSRTCTVHVLKKGPKNENPTY
jgi:hypothetical protein